MKERKPESVLASIQPLQSWLPRAQQVEDSRASRLPALSSRQTRQVHRHHFTNTAQKRGEAGFTKTPVTQLIVNSDPRLGQRRTPLPVCRALLDDINKPGPNFRQNKKADLSVPKEFFRKSLSLGFCSQLAILESGTLGSGENQPVRSLWEESLGPDNCLNCHYLISDSLTPAAAFLLRTQP